MMSQLSTTTMAIGRCYVVLCNMYLKHIQHITEAATATAAQQMPNAIKWYETWHLCAFSYVTLGRQPVKMYAGTEDTGSVVHQNVSGDGAESS